MGDDEKEDGRKDLALPATSALFAVVAAVGGLDPATFLSRAGVQAAAGVASAAITFASEFKRRKKERQTDRCVKLFHLLHERVQKLEEKVYTDGEEDLFLSVMKSALEDDEEQKAPFYVAALEWMIKAQPPAVHVRILSGAVRDLSYLELYCFLAEKHRHFAAQEDGRDVFLHMAVAALEQRLRHLRWPQRSGQTAIDDPCCGGTKNVA